MRNLRQVFLIGGLLEDCLRCRLVGVVLKYTNKVRVVVRLASWQCLCASDTATQARAVALGQPRKLPTVVVGTEMTTMADAMGNFRVWFVIGVRALLSIPAGTLPVGFFGRCTPDIPRPDASASWQYQRRHPKFSGIGPPPA